VGRTPVAGFTDGFPPALLVAAGLSLCGTLTALAMRRVATPGATVFRRQGDLAPPPTVEPQQQEERRTAMTDTVSPAVQTALAYYQAWTSLDLDTTVCYIADDIVCDAPVGRLVAVAGRCTFWRPTPPGTASGPACSDTTSTLIGFRVAGGLTGRHPDSSRSV
jgi:hypothetical protein